MKRTLLIFAALLIATLAISQTIIGDKGQWSKTSEEAAANDAQKAWLAKGKQQTITGEVVDVSCYMQLGKTGEKHMDCGAKCVRAGQPAGILTAEKELYLVMPEEHHPRRDGQVDLRETLASNMDKQVTATGMVQENKQGKAIFISALDMKK
ncbi:MAG: hypothetical protein JWO13_1017 [Acidobacteriales bacterium]|nr:hypothetical protein [Terriglobales bacterium]